MANTIIQLKHSTNTGTSPNSLANGELAINTFDGKMFYCDSNGAIQTIQRFTGPAGLNKEIQFNDSGVLGSNSGLTFDKPTGLLSATVIKSTQSSGDEGGQIDLATSASNTTLAGGSVSIDIYQNKLRFFETGGTNRGVFIDISSATNSVGTDLLASSGSVDTVARTSAQGAFDKANSANVLTQAAYDKANTDTTNVSASAGVYGNNSIIPTLRVESNGRVSSITNTTISIDTSQIASGTLASARISGDYTGITGVDTLTKGTWTANSISTTYTDAKITSVGGQTGAISNTQLLDFIKTVDGVSSGLDADLLDGLNSTSFANSTFTQAAFDKANTDVTNISISTGTYGNSTIIPVFKIESNGRISEIANATISIDTSQIGSGIIPIHHGGTNQSSFTSGNLVFFNGTSLTSLPNNTTTVTGGLSSTNTITSLTINSYGSITGYTGASIEIDATQIVSGKIPPARISGHYLGITGVDTLTKGNWEANTISTTYTDAKITSVGGQTGAISNTQLLDFIKTVDGVSSGLDADLLDGLNSTSFANSTFTQAAFDKANTDTTNISITANTFGSSSIVPVFHVEANGRISTIANSTISIDTSQIGSGTLASARISGDYTGITGVDTLTKGTWTANTISTTYTDAKITSVGGQTGAISNTQLLNFISAVDGSGSGLDADLLDGLNSTSFANSTFAQAAFDKANTNSTATTITNDALSSTSRYILLTTQTSGTLSIANTSMDGLYYVPSTGTFNANNFNCLSDERYKENIETIDDAKFVVENLRGVSFNWKNTGQKAYGVIAQELEIILPELVQQNESGMKTVNYDAIIPFLIEAIKTQQKELNNLKKFIETNYSNKDV